mgnify:CR=1
MSVWTEFTGTIVMRKGSKCSIATLLHNIYSETICNVVVEKYTDAHVHYKVKWSCSFDGWDVEDYMTRLVQCLKGYDQQAKMDINVNTRFSC